MTTPEIIKELCKSKNITVNSLENELGFSHGALKSPNIKSERLLELARYFDVSMEYLMGELDPTLDEDLQIIQRERTKMNDKQKQKLMNIISASFDDFNWSKDDSGNIK